MRFDEVCVVGVVFGIVFGEVVTIVCDVYGVVVRRTFVLFGLFGVFIWFMYDGISVLVYSITRLGF